MTDQPGAAEGTPQWTPPGGDQPPAPVSQPAGPYGPPYGPQSAPPYGPQSAPPYGPQSAPPYGPQSAPPPYAQWPGQPAAGPTFAPPAPAALMGAPVSQYAPPGAAQPLGPVRVEPVPGTEFGVAYLPVPPTMSGLAIGSLVAGIGSIAIAFVVGCFGVAGADAGWGPIVAGAFAVLAGLLGLAGVGVGLAAMRQIRNGSGRMTGRGLAIAGMACGGVGVLLTAVGMLLSLVVLAV